MSRAPARLGALAILLAAALAGAALAAVGALSGDGGGPLVLVSGRDDHGLLVHHEVPLFAEPGSPVPAGRVHDGRVARVVEERGDWLKVRAVGEPAAEGWVNDFWLRDRAVRLDVPAQVRLVDAVAEAGRVRVAVRPVADASATPAWVELAQLREVGARGGHAP